LQNVDFLTQAIDSTCPDFSVGCVPFGFLLRNPYGELRGGCNGFFLYGAVDTDQLWVHPEERGKGWGRFLMEQVHIWGKESGCHIATVRTMSFQKALLFYQALGYRTDYTRTGYIQNSSCLFLSKKL
jgi:GNAT superfamily N-acetyltransferase